jgi:hypothetical protein
MPRWSLSWSTVPAAFSSGARSIRLLAKHSDIGTIPNIDVNIKRSLGKRDSSSNARSASPGGGHPRTSTIGIAYGNEAPSHFSLRGRTPTSGLSLSSPYLPGGRSPSMRAWGDQHRGESQAITRDPAVAVRLLTDAQLFCRGNDRVTSLRSPLQGIAQASPPPHTHLLLRGASEVAGIGNARTASLSRRHRAIFEDALGLKFCCAAI